MASAAGKPAERASRAHRAHALRLRLRVLRRGDRLDRALALGCSPQIRPELELRAQQLTSRRSRDRLARSLRRAVAEARRPQARRLGAAVPVRQATVRPWCEALIGLAERLETSGPLSAATIARIHALLTDGTGPLYHDHPERTLAGTIWWIADAMQECPPHDWHCPDERPGRRGEVLWTCAACGATAASDDLTRLPHDPGRLA